MYINRRTFLKGAAGVGVAAAVASSVFYIKNQSPEEVANLMANSSLKEADVLVIGGGIAGVMAAMRAVESGATVVMVDKGSVGRSGQTPFANDFRVFDEESGDDRDKWVEDWTTLTGGMHHSAYLDDFLSNSKSIFEELEGWGATSVGFGGVLREKIMAQENITLVERTMLTTLLEVDGTVVGAVGFSLDTEEVCVVKSKSVVLCTGAGAFKPNGFPVRSLTFDGDAMAYRIGGKISGKEFMDTHTGSSESPAYCWGGTSRKWNNGLYTINEGPDLEGGGLGLQSYYSAHNGEISGSSSVESKMPEDQSEGGQNGPPSGDSQEGEKPSGPPSGERQEGNMPSGPPGGGTGGGGPQMSGTEIGGTSAGLGVHKCEGLYPMDGKCGTNITGLFAAGDSLSSMLAGTQYIGVNGTAFGASATQGALAGATAAEYSKTADVPSISDDEVDAVKEAMFAPRGLTEGYSAEWVTQMIQFNTMPYYVLFIKKKDRLEAALKNIEFFRDHYADKMVASNVHELRLVHETRNMLLNAEMKLKASLYRTESRGNHYREDYPDESSDWKAWVVIEKDSDGEMVLSKVSAN
jgi:succinate dehydrogenase/fumarate reductase flavoprotein subunit